VAEVDAEVDLLEGDDAEVALYVEMGDALEEVDGDTTLSPVPVDGTTLEQLAGTRTNAPSFEMWCTEGLDVSFDLFRGNATVEVSWTVAVVTVGAFVNTKLEVRIEA
jgi:hypothetical protein